MNIALIHDHLTQDGGAEKVLAALHSLFPQSPTYTLVYQPSAVHPDFQKRDIRTSFIQKLPGGVRHLPWYLWAMPAATEHYDLSAFDVIISSTSMFAKGVITKPGAIHLCYCHTPTRFLWTDAHHYVNELQQGVLVKKTLPLLLTKLRQWDRLAAERVTLFIANSHEVQKRISTYYHRDSVVIHPPVDVENFQPQPTLGNYFLTGGRLVPYKRFDLTIEAFRRTGFPLKIFGEGPALRALQRKASPNITFVGKVDEATKKALFEQCQAFIHPQREDFGITAIEAMAAGRPVIAFAAGGALETVVDGVTGLFFHEQAWEPLADILVRFNTNTFDGQKIHAHARQFDRSIFNEKIMAVLNTAWANRPHQEQAKPKAPRLPLQP